MNDSTTSLVDVKHSVHDKGKMAGAVVGLY